MTLSPDQILNQNSKRKEIVFLESGRDPNPNQEIKDEIHDSITRSNPKSITQWKRTQR